MITIHCKGDLPRTQAFLSGIAQGHPDTMMKFRRSGLTGALLDICCPCACTQIAPGSSLRLLKYLQPWLKPLNSASGVQDGAFSKYCRYLGRASEIKKKERD